MTARQQWAVVGVVVAVLAAALGAASHFMKDDLFPVTIGSTAPEFRVKDLGTNQYRTLADYKGKALVLNVWATYCEPCKVEMPSLEALHKAYGDSGLKIVAVEIDPSVTDDSVRTYARNLGITFEVLHDPTHALEKAYQTTGYPETFVIGPEGTIRKKWIGPDNWTSLGNRALIAQLLGLATPRPAAVIGER
jgi:cytochrome c biogenesis protein CcmG, thiol:disulfide interchange protein DsbE